MKKILIMGAGSSQSNGVVNCLLNSGEEIIGAGSSPTDLIFCKTEKKFLIPHSLAPEYKETLLRLLKLEKPDFIHFQHDQELFIASAFRDEILALGVKLFIPSHEDIETCVFKHKSYLKFQEAGIKVPQNMLINNEDDLKTALEILTKKHKKIWLRETAIGGGGKGAVATDNFNFAKEWIIRHNGFGKFAAAEILTEKSATFLSIWHEGKLVVGQGRSRFGWSGRSISGVTGITKIGKISTSQDIVDTGLKAVNAVSKNPHGIFGVDMTYDFDGVLNPTEINIGRFFTTVEFFEKAGLSMPKILKDIALYDKFPELKNPINPITNNDLIWLRAMDEKPILTTENELQKILLKI